MDWLTIVVAGLTAAVFGTLAVVVQKFAEKPPRPLLVRNGSVIGEFMVMYCEKTKTPIESICLVAHAIDEETTVFHVKSLDLFPEIWLGEEI